MKQYETVPGDQEVFNISFLLSHLHTTVDDSTLW